MTGRSRRRETVRAEVAVGGDRGGEGRRMRLATPLDP